MGFFQGSKKSNTNHPHYNSCNHQPSCSNIELHLPLSTLGSCKLHLQHIDPPKQPWNNLNSPSTHGGVHPTTKFVAIRVRAAQKPLTWISVCPRCFYDLLGSTMDAEVVLLMQSANVAAATHCGRWRMQNGEQEVKNGEEDGKGGKIDNGEEDGQEMLWVEPFNSNKMALSLHHGQRVELEKVGQLAVQVVVKKVGEEGFSLCKS
ncbi:hypothetical protein Vadar_016561 [Vaccinium darrowii]|uniref:Uncharacterized protein n=1 Tax=Vaccinium darrowii TaxID=229202 RepID=A0ACB7XR41_9ERIC|nr:hypothetical protein Vadar_016561 [Vaccinium darrowii]